MSQESSGKRTLLFVLLVFVVGVAGVFVGNVLRSHMTVQGNSVVTTRVPTSLLEVGDEFPEAVLLDEDGGRHNTLDLLAAGGVVLFLDLECPPCALMALRWQRVIDDAALDATSLFAVTYHPHDAIREFKVQNGLHMTVLQDSLQTFHRDYEVDRFPLEVVVGASGRIRSTSYDSESPIDLVALHRHLAD